MCWMNPLCQLKSPIWSTKCYNVEWSKLVYWLFKSNISLKLIWDICRLETHMLAYLYYCLTEPRLHIWVDQNPDSHISIEAIPHVGQKLIWQIPTCGLTKIPCMVWPPSLPGSLCVFAVSSCCVFLCFSCLPCRLQKHNSERLVSFDIWPSFIYIIPL